MIPTLAPFRPPLLPAVLILALAGCQMQAPGDAGADRCSVPRLAAAWQNTPPAARPADPPPRASVLPIPALTDTEAAAVGDCMRPRLSAIAAGSDNPVLRDTAGWSRFSRQFYGSEHGRYIEVSGNALAAAYLRFEDGPRLPVGAVIGKQSFRVLHSGAVQPNNQFLMERMPAGYDDRVADWKFTVVSPDGVTIGETRGRNGDRVEYCIECHKSARRQDFLFFIPPDYRPRG